MPTDIKIESQRIGCDRADLDNAERELRDELKRVYENLYKREVPKLRRDKISLSGFWKYVTYIGAIEELRDDANKTVHLTRVRSAHKRK